MGRIRNPFGRRSLPDLLARIRRRLAAGQFDEAQRLLSAGLETYPDAEPLRELDLSIRRAQARAGILSLRARVDRDDDPRAYEELIELYLELGLVGEARREAQRYARAHPDRDTPHLLLGELGLQGFFEHLLAREAHLAHRELRRAAALNRQALKPRLMLAELFYCVGADGALANVIADLESIAPGDPLLEPIFNRVQADLPPPGQEERLDGIFERVEFNGTLVRQAAAWPLRNRRRRVLRVNAQRAQEAADRIVERGDAVEIVLLHRNGMFLAQAPAAEDGGPEGSAPANRSRLAEVAGVVARTIARYARDLDLGSFKRCTIQGKFGLLTVGEVGSVVTGVRWKPHPEPSRLWERVTVGLEGALTGGKP